MTSIINVTEASEIVLEHYFSPTSLISQFQPVLNSFHAHLSPIILPFLKVFISAQYNTVPVLLPLSSTLTLILSYCV